MANVYDIIIRPIITERSMLSLIHISEPTRRP